MSGYIKKYLPEILLTLLVLLYSVYFSLLTINRADKLYAHYFDLGIMDQTVHNTFKAIQTGNLSRLLEMTDPHISAEQLKRMSVHNDMFLALLAPFYFFHDGFATLLIIQTLVLAAGAIYVYLIGGHIFRKLPYSKWLSLLFSFSFLLYSPMELANKFDFHAVTLATTFLLAMFYYWLEKKYWRSALFAVCSILTKEEVGLTTAFFGGYILLEQYLQHKDLSFIERIIMQIKEFFHKKETNTESQFVLKIIVVSIVWIALSMFVIIPLSRGKEHFAAQYYDYIKENPLQIFGYIFSAGTLEYLNKLLGPTGFLALFSPLTFLISLPELAINILSTNDSMRNTYFHYDSVITPFVFIASMYGFMVVYEWLSKKKIKQTSIILGLVVYVGIMTVLYAYQNGPLPLAKEADLYPWNPPQQKYYEVIAWKKILDDDQIKVSTTGVIAPHFTTREYFYDFSWKYKYADYVIIDENDALNGYLKDRSIPAYKDLQNDNNYIKIYDENGIEVYRKLK